ncbi:hypothetical protein IFM89_021792 [Coptis chinensis]|uniref:GDSL esterase/lipase n=1 Tax=Coptis chinensis TaxID=261450 RepID=A0A835M6H6_9MAGN|nr:hypothetical protein IFM89_021792 [Coptis chinensis]
MVANAVVPAVFVFGDSTADVGTNNYIKDTKAKANFPQNGIDFPGSVPTGRFSNGFNSADFLAQQMGFNSSPPPFFTLMKGKLGLHKHDVLRGVNFASGGSGLLDATGKGPFVLYLLGARKFGIISIPPIGCCPSHRIFNDTSAGGCLEGLNEYSRLFFLSIGTLLQQLSSELKDMKYSLGNTYDMVSFLLNNPLPISKEVRSACCGSGKFNGEDKCNPTAQLCPNRDEYLFWDLHHPTQAAAQLAVLTLYEGGPEFVAPINFKELVEAN